MKADRDEITPNIIHISEDEQQTRKLSSRNIQDGLKEFHKNGLVILQNAVGISALEHIRERMLQDIPKNLTSPNLQYNHGRDHKNVSQTPPLMAEYLHEEIWANRFAIALIEHIIGPRPQLSFASSNIALPESQGRQAVHSDYYCSHMDFPVFLEVNIYLDDISSRNGSTEVWLGTHNGYNKKDHAFSDAGWIKSEVFTARAEICPPLQPAIPRSSVCIRDLRLWHAGMPNYTSVPRIMLAFIYSPSWFKSHMRLRFPADAREKIESWEHIDCLSVSEFVEGNLDYLEFRQELNLTQEKSDPSNKYVPKHGAMAAGPENYWIPSNGKVS